MTGISNEDADRLGAIYAVANTPIYLYHHYRRDPSVQRIAALGVQRLANELRQALSRDRATSDMATAYALVTAMTFYPPEDVRRAAEGLDLTSIHWASDILNYHRLTYVSNDATIASSTHLRPQLPQSLNTADASTVTFVPRHDA